MTKTVGVLSPATNNTPGCGNCVKMRKQAEDAFLELRTQTDKHIHAVQKKLKEDHQAEVTKLNLQIDALQLELKKIKDAQAGRDVGKEFEKRMQESRKEYEARINVVQTKLDEAESRLARQQEDSLRYTRREHLLRDARVQEVEKENDHLRSTVDKLEIEIQSLKCKLDRAKLEQDAFVEKQTKSLIIERDEAKQRLLLAEQRLAGLEAFKREAEIDKAKMDLNYRRRLGEMESEVRRTEIESVRLKREIIQLTQRLETAENLPSSNNSFPMLTSARSRLFAIEGGALFGTSSKPTQSGRIAKINERTGSPKRSPRAVEELPPHTPSMSRSDDSN
jgi:hypothetical protein